MKTKIILGTKYLLEVCLLLTFIYLVLRGFEIKILLPIFLVNLIIKAVVYKIVLKRLNEKYLLLFSLLIDLFIPYIYSVIHFSNFVERKRSQWN